MRQNEITFDFFEDKKTHWDLADCDKEVSAKNRQHFHDGNIKSHVTQISPQWEEAVPSLISKLVFEIAEKKKLEIRFNILQISVAALQTRLEKLESSRPNIIPINTFAPEPYELLRPILVSIQPNGDEFEAGWFDANIHTYGVNEEEAVSNLKNLILDYFDSFSSEPAEKLGPEPTRQFVVLKSFIQKKL